MVDCRMCSAVILEQLWQHPLILLNDGWLMKRRRAGSTSLPGYGLRAGAAGIENRLSQSLIMAAVFAAIFTIVSGLIWRYRTIK